MNTSGRPLMIFSAGLGTRMRPLTNDKPKPLLEFGGRPLIDRSLDYAEEVGSTPVVANMHYLADQIHAHLKPRGVRLSHEEHELLDTGGGLKQAQPLLGDGAVATLNPDALWLGPNPLRVLEEAWDGTGALLLCVPIERAIGRTVGDFATPGDRHLVRGTDWVYGGAQIIQMSAVSSVEASVFSLNLVWDELIAKRQLRMAVYPGRWCDLGTPEALKTGEALLAEEGAN